MEKVADLLARKFPQFNTVSPACLVSDALYQITSEKIEYLIILEVGRFKGIITPQDIAARILYEHRPLNKIRVTEFMNTTLPVVTTETSLQSCMQLMERYNVRYIIVFDKFEFKGVVSAYDLMQEALHHSKEVFSEEVPPRQGYPWNY